MISRALLRAASTGSVNSSDDCLRVADMRSAWANDHARTPKMVQSMKRNMRDRPRSKPSARAKLRLSPLITEVLAFPLRG